ncbi:MAG: AI-2E family transporter [Gemmataceae bacterium]
MDLKLGLAARIGLNLVAILGGVVTLRLGSTIFLPLIFAVFLATILWPSANRLHNYYRLPWPLACTTAVAGLVLFNVIVVGGALIAVPRLLQSVPNPNNPEAQRQFYSKLREQVNSYTHLNPDEVLPPNPDDSALFLTIKRTLEGEYVLQAVWTALGYVSAYLWQLILILFILLFLLMEGRMLTRRIVEVFGPSPGVQGKVVSALTAMSVVVRDFLIWRTVINIGIAVLVGVVYSFLGLRQAWVWALLTGVLCYIPYIGPIVAAGPPLLEALVSSPNGWYALAVLGFYSAIIVVEGYVIVPLLMGRHMDLNATTVMLACLFWELVWGVPGLFLAMPLMGAIKAICEHVPGWEAWANLMSARHVAPLAVVPVKPGGHLDNDDTAIVPQLTNVTRQS